MIIWTTRNNIIPRFNNVYFTNYENVLGTTMDVGERITN